jgi:hypothetical protein
VHCHFSDDDHNIDKSNITCYNCRAKGHYSNECPKEKRNHQFGTQVLTAGVEINDYDSDSDISFNFHMSGNSQAMSGKSHHQGAQVSKNWILLGNLSMVDVFCSSKLLKNIQKTNNMMHIKCNTGVTCTNWVGNLPGYGQVWYKKNGIANILSLSKVEEKYQITYNSHKTK